MLDSGDHSHQWCVFAGIWFLDVSGSQDYNKPEQTLAELLQNECANFVSQKQRYSFTSADWHMRTFNLPTNKWLFRVTSPEVGSVQCLNQKWYGLDLHTEPSGMLHTSEIGLQTILSSLSSSWCLVLPTKLIQTYLYNSMVTGLLLVKLERLSMLYENQGISDFQSQQLSFYR